MHSLRIKILTIVLAFFALIGAAFVLYSMVTTANYKRLRLENTRKIVEFETEKVNKEIAEVERSAVTFALNGYLFYTSQSYDIGAASVLEYLRSYPGAIGGGFWFEPYAYKKNIRHIGFYAFFDETSGEARLSEGTAEEDNDYDYYGKNWYRELADAIVRPNQVAWTKPYIDDDDSRRFMTTAGAGIFDKNGKLIGVSNVDWGIEEIIETLSKVSPTKNSFVLLSAPEHDYIISSTRADGIIGASLKSLPYDINADRFDFDGVSYLQFGRFMDNGWLLSVQIPENEIFAEIENENNRFSIIIALSSVVLLCFAYYLISRLINAPLRKLTSDVSQVALGNLDKRIELSSKDELGMLAQTFNKMTAELKAAIGEYNREHSEKERISAELNIATEIQTSMLPHRFSAFPGCFDLYASMRPAKEVGGDFYDFFSIDEDNLAVVVADVSGKGVPAALFMVVSKTLIKYNACSGKSPKEVFETVNDMLCEGNDTCMFVTAFMGFYNVPSGKFIYVNAGHNPPLIKRGGGGYEFLKSEAPCPILAWLKSSRYREYELDLQAGDAIYMYTDGVTEAVNRDYVLFSEERLLETLNKYADYQPKELLFTIKREIDVFADGASQADDITMLGLRINEIPSKPTMKKLSVKASVDNLDKVIYFVNAELDARNCSQKLRGEIDIAVDEVFVNIAGYAYPEVDGDVNIFISVDNEAVIRFEDAGIPFNPLKHAAPNIEQPLMEREIGGLGVYLVKRLMDKVEYVRDGDKNILVITKGIT